MPHLCHTRSLSLPRRRKIVAVGTGGWTGIEGCIRGLRGPKKKIFKNFGFYVNAEFVPHCLSHTTNAVSPKNIYENISRKYLRLKTNLSCKCRICATLSPSKIWTVHHIQFSSTKIYRNSIADSYQCNLTLR